MKSDPQTELLDSDREEFLLERAWDLGRLPSLFRDTIEQAPVGMGFVSRQGTYQHCNPALLDLLGYSATEMLGRPVAEVTAPEDLETAISGLERLWSGQLASLDAERRYLRRNGEPLWVRVSTALVRGSSGEAECAVEFVRDISARKELAAQLLQQQTLLATVVSELPLPLVACDHQGRITQFNRAAAELFGIDAMQSGTDYPITSAVLQADGITPVERSNRPLARALRGDDISDVEYVVTRPDGAARITLTSGRALKGPDDQSLGAVMVVQDITERRRAEEELERLNKQLIAASRQAGMAEVATSVLHNVGNVLNSVNVSAGILAERIRKSKCVGLERAAQLLTEHAADLPAFLSGPRGQHLPPYLSELATTLVAERDATARELAALRTNIEHIKGIVAMQQSYAKRGGLTERLDIRSLVEDSLGMNDAAFSRHGVTITRDFADVPPVLVDKHKVLQILVNIIRNARHACDEAPAGTEKRVTVSIGATHEVVFVRVTDSGVGIAAGNLERIFNHGFTTRKDGHGFGLHSSALAAKELGGSLRAESAGIGQGATFTLMLPRDPLETSDAQ